MSKGVLIQASFYEAMQVLPDRERLQLYDGICAYTLEGILPENLSPVAMSMFILMKPNIDSSAKKYSASVTNGKKGGRKAQNRNENQEEKPSENQSANQQQKPSENQNRNQKQKPSENQSADQKEKPSENHDYDLDLDSDLDLDYDLDLDLDSDSEKDFLPTADEPPVSPPKKKGMKHKYGEYKNVLLSEEELERLQEELPDWRNMIERLSEYIASSGKKYKSHYATLRSWNRREPKSNKPPQAYPEDDLSGIL